ncbi:hypothetical protein NDN08_000748 [Rhodosorus marinus]|uniref:Conserved oligomeric Golgi complex subunit 1 n=1 Tax=Rhodosorus marinus TaxID=101924 RepID=A0AAV8UT30_9RHOD|nr:hypothetical protein NDN08_000748 [Rhodosorus marinus]
MEAGSQFGYIGDGSGRGRDGNAESSPVAAAEASAMFRTKRVAEIKNIEVKLRTDADEKSAQLRKMLGTRYRDLIDTATGVASMDQGVEAVLKVMLEVERKARELQKSLRSEIDEATLTIAREKEDNELVRQKAAYSIGSQLKFLVDTREQLFASLDGNKIFEASQRFAGAEAARKSLLEDGNAKTSKAFVTFLWKEIAPFREDINSAAKQKFRAEGLGAREYTGALCALLTISASSFEDVIWEFLNARLEGIERTLTTGKAAPAESIRSATSGFRDLLCDVYKILLVPREEADEDILRVVSATKRFDDVHPDRLTRIVTDWLQKASPRIQKATDISLSEAKTGGKLREAQQALAPLYDTSDEELNRAKSAAFKFTSPDGLEALFQPTIKSRAEQRTREIIEKCFGSFLTNVAATVTSISETKEGDGNLGKTMWNQEPSPGKPKGASGLTKEYVAQPGLAGKLNEEFDNQVRLTVVQDLSAISSSIPEVATACRAKCAEAAPRLLEMKNQLVSNELRMALESQGVGDVKSQELSVPMEKLFLIAHVYQNLSTSNALSEVFRFGEDEGTESYNDSVNAAQIFFAQATEIAVETYAVALRGVAQELERTLTTLIVDQSGLELDRGWEKVQEDSGPWVYPAMPSYPAYDFAINSCWTVSYAGGSALPIDAVRSFADCLVSGVVNAYKQVSGGRFGKIAILQAIFDVRFLGAVFRGLEAKQNATTSGVGRNELRVVEAALVNLVDPVELAYSDEKILTAVKAAFAKSSVVLGAFTRTHQGKRVTAMRPSLSEGFKASSLLNLAQPAPRFQYLPAPLPSSYQRRAYSTKAALQTLEVETGGIVKASEVGSNNNGTEESDVVKIASSFATSVGRMSTQFLFSGLRRDQE